MGHQHQELDLYLNLLPCAETSQVFVTWPLTPLYLSTNSFFSHSLPSSIPRSIHPHFTSVSVTSVTWENDTPLKVTPPNWSQLHLNKSINIYHKTRPNLESEFSVLRTKHSSITSSGQEFFFVVPVLNAAFWHCWSSLNPFIKVRGLAPKVCCFTPFVSMFTFRHPPACDPS